MSKEPLAAEAHVVVATVPADVDDIVGPKLYAVIAHTIEEAEAAVQAVVPSDATVAATGGPLKPETIERLDLVSGEAKQIG